ncbi:MAG TPA: PEP-CTERM sorting domain-containing protein [Verrucomicrobia bacterium]|nr:PEP-CTERM sorting domain-containing protein [Verrucomicrobiales bacterium]HIL54036.1 PEP-CTERM sorting domain-containing protein [Verrucomicrobiota bacterium]
MIPFTSMRFRPVKLISEKPYGQITNSFNGGFPSENEVLPGVASNIAGGNPADLASTQNFSFTANGTNDVVVRFATLDNAGQGVHRQFFALNGFQLGQQIPEPSTSLLSLLGAGLFLRRRR